MPLDVSSPDHLDAVFGRIEKEWGQLDILVHSIAWAPKVKLEDGSEEEHKVIDTKDPKDYKMPVDRLLPL